MDFRGRVSGFSVGFCWVGIFGKFQMVVIQVRRRVVKNRERKILIKTKLHNKQDMRSILGEIQKLGNVRLGMEGFANFVTVES